MQGDIPIRRIITEVWQRNGRAVVTGTRLETRQKGIYTRSFHLRHARSAINVLPIVGQLRPFNLLTRHESFADANCTGWYQSVALRYAAPATSKRLPRKRGVSRRDARSNYVARIIRRQAARKRPTRKLILDCSLEKIEKVIREFTTACGYDGAWRWRI